MTAACYRFSINTMPVCHSQNGEEVCTYVLESGRQPEFLRKRRQEVCTYVLEKGLLILILENEQKAVCFYVLVKEVETVCYCEPVKEQAAACF